MSNFSIENILKFVKKEQAIIHFGKDKDAAESAVNELYTLLKNNKTILPKGKLDVEFRDTHLTNKDVNEKISKIRENKVKLGLHNVIVSESLNWNFNNKK